MTIFTVIPFQLEILLHLASEGGAVPVKEAGDTKEEVND